LIPQFLDGIPSHVQTRRHNEFYGSIQEVIGISVPCSERGLAYESAERFGQKTAHVTTSRQLKSNPSPGKDPIHILNERCKAGIPVEVQVVVLVEVMNSHSERFRHSPCHELEEVQNRQGWRKRGVRRPS
jgi:hypothetical protein